MFIYLFIWEKICSGGVGGYIIHNIINNGWKDSERRDDRRIDGGRALTLQYTPLHMGALLIFQSSFTYLQNVKMSKPTPQTLLCATFAAIHFLVDPSVNRLE